MSHYAYGMGWASASSGPLDRFKMTVAEGGTRSPLIQDRGHDIGDVGEHADLARALDARPGESPFRGVTLPGKPRSRSWGACGGWRGQKRSPTVRAMGLRTGVNYVI